MENEHIQEDTNIQTQKVPIRVAITHGDTNGVGYELIFKTFEENNIFDICTPIVYGSAKIATYHRKAIDSNTYFYVINRADEARDGQLNLVNCFDQEIVVTLGHPSEEAGLAALIALEAAVEDLKAGKVDVLVTAPINKATIQSEHFAFQGHTEYLQSKLEGNALMILTNEMMRVALVTTHLAVKNIASAITSEKVESKIRQLYHVLRHDYLISSPRIAVFGLNPHNGDAGTIGTEDTDIIAPVIQNLQEEGLPVFGPYSADGFFGAGHFTKFDGILAMYHDQGLAPFKALSMEDGVNYTAGLNFVRTSPDHGVAYDIAGKGIASESSFRQALYAAIDIYRNRLIDEDVSKNPLPKLYQDRREDERRSFTPRPEKASHEGGEN
jgi:4-hydroxythreonine-4-phosphate dehydrogenase